MIKDRPRRLDLIYTNKPLYFVTFATRDRKRIPSLDVARAALEQYAHRAIENFNVALGRYVIMPDHVHLRSRRPRLHTVGVDWWFKARDVCHAGVAQTLATWIL